MDKLVEIIQSTTLNQDVKAVALAIMTISNERQFSGQYQYQIVSFIADYKPKQWKEATT